MKFVKFAVCMSPSARRGQRRCRSAPLRRKINLWQRKRSACGGEPRANV